MNIYTKPITKLKADEVFVFGANLQGFHGAGAAGYATFGITGNKWRDYGYDKLPNGIKGNWTVKGALGLQEGTHGKSYALPTVTRPGARRSLIIDFKPLYECCVEHSSWKFYLAQRGSTGYNGWTPGEVASMMKAAGDIPSNLYIDASFAPYLL